MDKNKVKGYEAPKVEVIEVDVEQGFASSNGIFDNSSINGWGNGDSFDDEIFM